MKKIILYAATLAIASSAIYSCVDDDVYVGPATISNIQYSPLTVTVDDDVNVSATISSLQDVEAFVVYNVNNGADSIIQMAESEALFVATIPAQDSGAFVTFAVQAITSAGFVSQSDPLTYQVGKVATDFSTLMLNELNGNLKFIEIYNSGTDTIPLKGCYLMKDELTTIWTAPDTTMLPGGLLLLYSVDVEATYPDQPDSLLFNSGLSSKKTLSIGLYTPTSGQIDVFERGVSPWGTTISDTGTPSYARCPDGTDNWQLANPTPGTTNPTSGDGAIPQL